MGKRKARKAKREASQLRDELSEEDGWLERFEADRDAGKVTFQGVPQPDDPDEPEVDDRDRSKSVRAWPSSFGSNRRRN